MLARGDVVGVFQVESQGMRRALVDMRPDRFEDIIALVALYRPGPMANIPTYCARKHGDEEPEYLHPDARADPEGDLRRHHLPGTGDADRAGHGRLFARRSRPVAPRDGQEDPLRDGKAARGFVAGSVKNNVPKGQADTIFELLAKFADYGFNKSHAAAYALVSYQTAYMKAHYPVEFLAASMTLDHQQHRQAVGVSRRSAAARHQGRGALGQPFRRHLRSQRRHHLLRAGGPEGRRPPGGRTDRGGAQRAACSPHWRISRPG